MQSGYAKPADINSQATELVAQLGARAVAHAKSRANEMKARGDLAACQYWAAMAWSAQKLST